MPPAVTTRGRPSGRNGILLLFALTVVLVSVMTFSFMPHGTAIGPEIQQYRPPPLAMPAPDVRQNEPLQQEQTTIVPQQQPPPPLPIETLQRELTKENPLIETPAPLRPGELRRERPVPIVTADARKIVVDRDGHLKGILDDSNTGRPNVPEVGKPLPGQTEPVRMTQPGGVPPPPPRSDAAQAWLPTEKPRLTVLTYSNKYYTYLCELLRSAFFNGISVKVMGWDSGEYGGHGKKLAAQLEALKGMHDEELVMFVDAHDVIIQENVNTILEKFLAMKQRVVFAAEKGCWPFEQFPDGYNICHNIYPPSPSPWRYLNSGTWIGYAKEAREIMMMVAGNRTEEQLKGVWDDQELIAKAFLDRKVKLALDYNCELFQTVHMSWDDMELVGNKWRNKITHTSPSMFHFNGGSKQEQTRFDRGLWFHGGGAPAEAIKKVEDSIVDGVGQSFREFCATQTRVPL